MRVPLLAVVAAALALPAAAEEPYLDDRSDPAALVKSLYNAINRKEYARAWSYFSGKPAGDLDSYAEGYADTESVRVEVGLPSEEGAAGSVFYYLPVAISARNEAGDTYVYGGCYELRLGNPQIQGEDFAPLQIVRGRLSPGSGTIDEALPATCNDGAPPDPSLLVERRARNLFRDGFKELCQSDIESIEPDQAFSSYLVRFSYSYASEGDPASEARIFRFLCNRGAYNESHVFIMADDYGQLKILSFATPDLDIRYQDDDSEKPVETLDIIGFRSQQELVNSDFDPSTLTLTSFAKWRGLGDASSVGTWILRDGEFSLTRYDVDATYDGDINPETVLDYHSGP